MILKTAWRNILKDRQFTMLNLVGLATGLACAILIYLWVNDELHVNKFTADDSRLYQVKEYADMPGSTSAGDDTPGLLAEAVAKEMPEAEYATAAIQPQRENPKGIFTIGEAHIEAADMCVGKDFFNVFPYQLLQGDKNDVLANKNAVVISDELAIKLFHTTENVIGKTLAWNRVKTSGLYTVTGVFKKVPNVTALQFDALFNYSLVFEKSPGLKSWTNGGPYTYFLLKKGTDVAQFNTKIKNLIRVKSGSTEVKTSLFAQRFTDTYLYNRYENGVPAGGRIAYVKLFSVIALFILVIACINFMNLSTAKAAGRMKEAGIKKVMGACRASLITQYMGESVLMAFLALLLASILVVLLLPQFNQITDKHIILNVDAAVVATILGITLITGILSGSYPALFLSNFHPITALKGRLKTSASEVLVRKGLVVFQFVISVFLIVAVAVVYKQVQLVQTKNLGYNRDNVIYFERKQPVNDSAAYYQPGGGYENDFTSFLDKIRNVPGVVAASNFRHSIAAGRDGGTTDIQWAGKSSEDNTEFTDLEAGYDYIKTLGIEMKEGRDFSKSYGAEGDKIVLNETAVKAMGLTNPVGKFVKLWGDNRQIIGVVKDFNFQSLYEKVKPCFFYLSMKQNVSKILVRIKAGKEQTTIASLEKLYKQYNLGLSFDYTFLDEDYQAMYATEMRVAALSKYFAAVAIIISCLGLFGLAAFTAQKRQKEMSIRKAIGATVSNIALLLSTDFLQLVTIAALIAFPVAWWAVSAWLQGFAYHVTIGASVFIASGLAIIGITILTIGWQAVKAGLANPVEALRDLTP